MGQGNTLRRRLHDELVDTLVHMGYPEVFGHDIADQLRSEKAMRRMIGYLHNARPRSAEEIADEMLAICYDRETWRKKKETEYYNEKYNEQLNQEL